MCAMQVQGYLSANIQDHCNVFMDPDPMMSGLCIGQHVICAWARESIWTRVCKLLETA